MSPPGYPFPWILQMYCFPYRSVAAGKWSAKWPWWAAMPAALTEASREAFELRHLNSP